MKKYLGLVHSPILGKRGETITTSVTNMDVHDIARSARTFGLDGYFIITPIQAQHELVQKILDYWNTDMASDYNPDRSSALSFIRLATSIEEAQKMILEENSVDKINTIATGANFETDDGDENVLRDKLIVDNIPMFLLFGTGWGLHADIVERADFKLTPINGSSSDGYNHLSVRSAVAIYLDRISSSFSEIS